MENITAKGLKSFGEFPSSTVLLAYLISAPFLHRVSSLRVFGQLTVPFAPQHTSIFVPGPPSDSETPSLKKNDGLSIHSELLRKGLHILALVIPFGMLTLDRSVVVSITGVLALSCIALELSRAYSSSVNAAVIAVLGPIMRPPEEQTTLDQVEFSGATHIVISAALLSLLVPAKIGAPLLAMFVIADGLAAVVGRNYGQLQLPCTEKTMEGFFTFGLSGTTVLLIITDFSFLLSLLMPFISGFLEVLPFDINDNLYVPTTSSFILHFIFTLSI